MVLVVVSCPEKRPRSSCAALLFGSVEIPESVLWKLRSSQQMIGRVETQRGGRGSKLKKRIEKGKKKKRGPVSGSKREAEVKELIEGDQRELPQPEKKVTDLESRTRSRGQAGTKKRREKKEVRSKVGRQLAHKMHDRRGTPRSKQARRQRGVVSLGCVR